MRKKVFGLGMGIVIGTQACNDPLITGDDSGSECRIENAEGICDATSAHTKKITIDLLTKDPFMCEQEATIPIGVDVQTTGGGPVTYSFSSWGAGAGTLNSGDKNGFLELTPDTQLTGTVSTTYPNKPVTVKIWTIDPATGQKKTVDVYTTSCNRIPPCESGVTSKCALRSSNNKSVTAYATFKNCTSFSANVCLNTSFQIPQGSTTQRHALNTQTGNYLQLPNNGQTSSPIIAFSSGSWQISVTICTPCGGIPTQGTMTVVFPNNSYNQQHNLTDNFPLGYTIPISLEDTNCND